MGRHRVSPPLALGLLLACWAVLQAAGGRSIRRPTAIRPLVLDLNRSPAGLLLLLPGVGPARAAAIVADRAARGPYRRLADLERIKGIGPKTVEAIRPFARASDP